MLERGTVVSVSRGVLTVTMEASEACETCGACAAGASGARVLEGVIDERGARLGDLVEIETPQGARRAAQALVYVVPVVALVVGYLAGFLLANAVGFAAADSAGALAALIAVLLVLASLRARDRAFDVPSARPRVRAIIARGHDGQADPSSAGTGDQNTSE